MPRTDQYQRPRSDLSAMSEYYHTFLSSVSGIGNNAVPYPQTSRPPVSSPTTASMDEHSAAPNSLQNVSYYTGFPEPIIQYQPPKTQRNRRKSTPGPDHIKHRRTRSGCFTCRGRRVKCDETRPICESKRVSTLDFVALVVDCLSRMSQGQTRLCISGAITEQQEIFHVAGLERCGAKPANQSDIFS